MRSIFILKNKSVGKREMETSLLCPLLDVIREKLIESIFRVSHPAKDTTEMLKCIIHSVQ